MYISQKLVSFPEPQALPQFDPVSCILTFYQWRTYPQPKKLTHVYFLLHPKFNFQRTNAFFELFSCKQISRATMIRAAFRAITEALPTTSLTSIEDRSSPLHSQPEPEEHEGDRLKTLCDLCSAADEMDDLSVDLTTVASGSHTVNSSNCGKSSSYH